MAGFKEKYDAEFGKLKDNLKLDEYLHSPEFTGRMFHLHAALQEIRRKKRQYWEDVIYAELDQIIKKYMDLKGKS